MTNTKDWSEYYSITKELPPTPLLVRALEHVKTKGKALDVGAGALKNTRYLLSLGFEVTAIDSDSMMKQLADELHSDKLTAITTTFADYEFPKAKFDLVTAMFALPFNPPETFDAMFIKLKESLADGGIFCGHFFGPNDDWAKNPNMTFHTKSEVKNLLSDLEIISFKEVQEDGTTANGTAKHWHVFHVIAKK